GKHQQVDGGGNEHQHQQEDGEQQAGQAVPPAPGLAAGLENPQIGGEVRRGVSDSLIQLLHRRQPQ
ncbi:hypothetical protein EBS40_09790, partial [bacterium]|nr:hypothetical protein [bacterium]